MYCPKCNNRRTHINGSHADKRLLIETRRRECVKCHYKFNTQEKILEQPTMEAWMRRSRSETSSVGRA
jgi:transcriptional regulator NrdR family protein